MRGQAGAHFPRDQKHTALTVDCNGSRCEDRDWSSPLVRGMKCYASTTCCQSMGIEGVMRYMIALVNTTSGMGCTQIATSLSNAVRYVRLGEYMAIRIFLIICDQTRRILFIPFTSTISTPLENLRAMKLSTSLWWLMP